MHEYSLEDALVSKETSAFDLSASHNKLQGMVQAASDRLARKRKWIEITRLVLNSSQRLRFERGKNRLSKCVFNDVIHLLWHSLTRRVLTRSRIYNVKYFKFVYDSMFLERSENIRTQWKVWSRALWRKNHRQDLREDWVSLASVLQKKAVVSEERNYRKVRFESVDNQKRKWQLLSSQLLRRERAAEVQRRYDAIWRLTRFFHRALVNFRARQTVKRVVGFAWNANEFVKADIMDACLVINRFARRWLARKARLFAAAYCDEIFESSFVHLTPLLQQHE